eukprot:CAMPEP_0194143588 /NCGR_PEP_ID=MMETSP0152-20130528/12726_1 /TAXON_ID=1049557 /ORGANISM="Thalassiothrix antarctica, Strain L6-D1" /LENGTH=722 /DNA_ID=CAMNT_0038843057 /DNA_START=45 /DNA_END=2213 /DNA_ORIENTATION=-
MEISSAVVSDEEDYSKSTLGKPGGVNETDRQELPNYNGVLIESNSKLTSNNNITGKIPSSDAVGNYNNDNEGICLERNESSSFYHQKQQDFEISLPSSSSSSPSSRDEFSPDTRTPSKMDHIRKKLREKEQNLNAMFEKQSKVYKNPMIRKATIDTAAVEDSRNILMNETKSDSTVTSTTSLSTTPNYNNNNVICRLDGKEEADRREAVRVLSQTALHLQKKLKEEKNDANRLQKEVEILMLSLQRQQGERSKTEKQLTKIQKENVCNSRLIQEFEMDLQKKANRIEGLEKSNQLYQEREKKMQDDFMTWTQKDSLSKVEQIEYLEYQNLAKNNEIDDLRQELNRMLRKVVGLEVDLETHEYRFHSDMDRFCSSMVQHQQQQQRFIGEDEITRSTVDESLCTLRETRSSHIKDNNLHLSSPSTIRTNSKRGFGGLKRMISFKKKDKTIIKNKKNDEGNYDTTSRLQTDLNNLEVRYKKDRSRSMAHIEQLKQENHEYLIKILTLKKSLRQQQQSSSSEQQQQLSESGSSLGYDLTEDELTEENLGSTYDQTAAESSLPTKESYLEKSVETLKNARFLQNLAIEDLHKRVNNYEVEAEKQFSHEEDLTKQYTIELETKDLKIAALERELANSSTSSNNNINKQEHIAKKKDLHVKAAIGLEVKLQEALTEIVMFRKAKEVKDKQIEILRTETKELRMRMQEKNQQENILSTTTNNETVDIIPK